MYARQYRTPYEVYLYTLLFGCSLGALLREGIDRSRQFDMGGEYYGQLPGLKKGWMFGWRMDLSDIQWREFRKNLPALSAFFLLFTSFSRWVRAALPQWHIHYHVATSLMFVAYLHGSYVVHLLLAVLLNFVLSWATAGTTAGPVIAWILNPAMLILARIEDGIPFSKVSNSLAWLDQLKGPLRWHIVFNLTILRLISYSMDHHWRKKTNSGLKRTIELSQNVGLDPHSRVKARSVALLPLRQYSLVYYLAYVFYPPLYIAGPISTYNNFAYQQCNRESLPLARVFQYGLRWLVAFLLLELLSHAIYVNALAKYRIWHKHKWTHPSTLSMLGFFVLIYMWFKFVVIWRFFRFWSLLDNLEAPENMCRCIFNNYDIEGFWKNWHASYNLWLVRYMYIPLGGSRTRVVNVWLIFTFVALWHDLEWKVLSWAWIMAGFIIPEMVVKVLVQQPRFHALQSHWIYRHLCAFFASLNIGVLISANMVGFVVGLEGAQDILQTLLSNWKFLAGGIGTFYCAAHVMFEIRNLEQIFGTRLCPYL